MRPIPLAHRKLIDTDPYFRVCARRNGQCSGRITIEHAWEYGGRQINEMWAYLPLCEYHHLGAGLNKEINHFLSIQRATAEELRKYPRKNWDQERRYLLRKYGTYPQNGVARMPTVRYTPAKVDEDVIHQ